MADFWEKEELVGKFDKNSKDQVIIKKVEKSGKQYIDIRIFWLDGNSGEYKPSQKGVTIPYEHFKNFQDIINTIE